MLVVHEFDSGSFGLLSRLDDGAIDERLQRLRKAVFAHNAAAVFRVDVRQEISCQLLALRTDFLRCRRLATQLQHPEPWL